MRGRGQDIRLPGREMAKSRKIFSDLISVVLITVLFLVILTLVVFSALTYQRSLDIQDGNNNTRAVLSYVTTAVKASEGSWVILEDRGGVQVLVINDGSTGYEQQIFWLDGQVMENYAKEGSAPSADGAVLIGTAESFEMKLIKKDLLMIRTDLGTSYVHIKAAI